MMETCHLSPSRWQGLDHTSPMLTGFAVRTKSAQEVWKGDIRSLFKSLRWAMCFRRLLEVTRVSHAKLLF